MTDLDTLTARILAFRDARDWARFHTPGNLASSIAIEAGELLELFQWDIDGTPPPDDEKRRRIAEELADIGIYALLLAHSQGIDLLDAIAAKIEANERKYPVEKSKGRSTKYTDL